jgi:sodium/hydrogen exchanger 8
MLVYFVEQILCLIGRAANIFPLAWLCNRYREHKITRKMQFVMWFSGVCVCVRKTRHSRDTAGLRGAIAFALTLYTRWGDETTRNVMIADTLVVVIFTTMLLGGATMPLLTVPPHISTYLTHTSYIPAT